MAALLHLIRLVRSSVLMVCIGLGALDQTEPSLSARRPSTADPPLLAPEVHTEQVAWDLMALLLSADRTRLNQGDGNRVGIQGKTLEFGQGCLET